MIMQLPLASLTIPCRGLSSDVMCAGQTETVRPRPESAPTQLIAVFLEADG